MLDLISRPQGLRKWERDDNVLRKRRTEIEDGERRATVNNVQLKYISFARSLPGNWEIPVITIQTSANEYLVSPPSAPFPSQRHTHTSFLSSLAVVSRRFAEKLSLETSTFLKNKKKQTKTPELWHSISVVR